MLHILDVFDDLTGDGRMLLLDAGLLALGLRRFRRDRLISD